MLFYLKVSSFLLFSPQRIPKLQFFWANVAQVLHSLCSGQALLKIKQSHTYARSPVRCQLVSSGTFTSIAAWCIEAPSTLATSAEALSAFIDIWEGATRLMGQINIQDQSSKASIHIFRCYSTFYIITIDSLASHLSHSSQDIQPCFNYENTIGSKWFQMFASGKSESIISEMCWKHQFIFKWCHQMGRNDLPFSLAQVWTWTDLW